MDCEPRHYSTRPYLCGDLADNWLELRRLGLTVNVDDVPALALYQRFG